MNRFIIVKNLCQTFFDGEEFMCFVRFFFVGVMNFIVSYSIYSLLILSSISYLVANPVAYVIGMLNSYLWNRFRTFRAKAHVAFSILSFTLTNLISWLFGYCIVIFCVKILLWQEFFAQIPSMAGATIANFYGLRFFAFGQRTRFNT